MKKYTKSHPQWLLSRLGLQYIELLLSMLSSTLIGAQGWNRNRLEPEPAGTGTGRTGTKTGTGRTGTGRAETEPNRTGV